MIIFVQLKRGHHGLFATQPGRLDLGKGVQQLLLAWLVGLWVVTAIEPFDRRDWLLLALLVLLRRGRGDSSSQ